MPAARITSPQAARSRAMRAAKASGPSSKGRRPFSSTTSAVSFEPVQEDGLAALGTSQSDGAGELSEQRATDGGQGRLGRRTGGADFSPAPRCAEAGDAAGRA